jgi:hypothetical protein
MIYLSVGDEVTIRYGRQQGQKGRIIRTQLADVYEVKVADGPILFYCAKGLQKELVEQVVPESEPQWRPIRTQLVGSKVESRSGAVG